MLITGIFIFGCVVGGCFGVAIMGLLQWDRVREGWEERQ